MKEKTKIVLIVTGIIFIIALFLLNLLILPKEKLEKEKPELLVQKYGFSTGVGINKWAYEGFSNYNNTINYKEQVMPKITDGKEFSKEKYEQLANLNDNIFVATETSEDGKHAFQIFKFNLGDIRNFTSLKTIWKGIGKGAQFQCLDVQNNQCTREDFAATAGTSIHVWHENGKFWTWAGGTFMEESESYEKFKSRTYHEFYKEITEETTGIPMNYYLDDENNIYILAITVMPANLKEGIPSVLKTDYVGIEVK